MKYFITAFISTIFIISAQAQTVNIAPDSTGMYLYREVIETGLTADENYKRIKNYIALNYRSANDVIQLDTKEQIIAKGIFTNSYTFYEEKVYHTLILDIKENKIRITYTGFSGQFGTSARIWKYEENESAFGFPKKKALKKSNEKLTEMIKEFKLVILKPVKSDDW